MSNLIKAVRDYPASGLAVDYTTDNGYNYIMCLTSSPLANCQICSISLIEDCLNECRDNSFVLSVVKKLSCEQKNLILMDIHENHLSRLQNIFTNYVYSTTFFESTNGSKRVLVLIKNPNNY